MSEILIKDDENHFNMMKIEDEMLEIYPWIVLNLDEIVVSIAY